MKAVAAFLLMLCCLAVGHAWNCREAPRLNNALQIDAGQGQVVATDRYRRVYFLSGSSWYRLGTVSLKHVSVGPAGLWGTTTTDRVYKFVGGNFRLASGLTMQQVDAGGDGQVVGVRSRSYDTYCVRDSFASLYRGVGTLSWSNLRRKMRYYSCGPKYGCWGVDTSYRVYVTQRITPSTCGTTTWTYVSGQRMRMIEVGTDGSVFGVTTSGRVYQRTGISSSRPYGRTWVAASVCLSIRHVSYDLRQLWLVTNSGLVMQCTH